MSYEEEPEELAVATTYRGAPLLPDKPREQTVWQKFLYAAIPWLKHKHELGEKLLEAKVEQERALARKTNSEAMVNIANAQKIAMETANLAAKRDQENAKETKATAGVEQMSSKQLAKELEDDFAELQAKIQELHYRHGTEVKLLSNKPAGQGEH